MHVSIHNLTKQLGSQPVLRHVSLEVQHQELFFLLGPSGCGKTTLLRLLAGFYQPDEGDVFFGSRRMNDVVPHLRNTGMVFQNYALWPHLTVAENVAYGLEVRRLRADERRRRVAEALAIVQMEAFADRSPNQLSGGQQQRVALARALVIRPDVLLLDEPLSNLDARLRLEMREEIRRIHAETRLTTIYVTHDQKEALSLADRVAILHAGVIEQVGTPQGVYRRPANRFVADFIGETNWLEAVVGELSATVARLVTPCGVFEIPPATGLKVQAPVWLGFRPEALRMGPGKVNSFKAVIRQVTYLGDVQQYGLELAGAGQIKAVEQNPPAARAAGDTLEVHLEPGDLFLLPRQTTPA